MNLFKNIHGSNAGYVLELYEKYLEDPNTVDAQARAYFERYGAQLQQALNGETAPATNGRVVSSAPAVAAVVDRVARVVSDDDLTKAMSVANLAQAIREYGHLDANSNPLFPPPSDPSLKLETHGLTEADLQQLPANLVGGPVCKGAANALEAIERLRAVYSGGAGYDYDHLTNPAERAWLREAAESRRFRQEIDPDGDNAIRLLKRLIKVETFERFLHKTFLGKKRFSIEGVDMLVPILDEIVMQSAKARVHSILIGMAHRGRLNVLAHVLNKFYGDILREFKDPLSDTNVDAQGYIGQTGDVKYHKGALRVMANQYGVTLGIKIAPNPSHLELVNPVVEGMARAAGTLADKPGPPTFDPNISTPVVIHGDASFSGQGTVAETLNFYNLEGYKTGGTIHIIANNQVGFTTMPGDGRSTRYASDLAKGFKIPIVHVNANDAVTCIEVARLATQYRNKFHKDFMIDLIGYRRYGHNEGDEPRFTQPQMYEKIDAMPTVREIWGQVLIDQGYITQAEIDELIERHLGRLQESLDSIDLDTPEDDPTDEVHHVEPGLARRTESKVAAERLRELHTSVMQFPDNFTIHPRLNRVITRRIEAVGTDLDEKSIDWGTAEQLAFATILADGIPIRLTGEDVKRGTFSHRHAVYFDAKTGAEFTPLQHFPQSQASFEIHNSPLTENATIGFEYGYNIERPDRLVVWEAQFGDFVNGAQMMIDQYIASGRAKWNQTPSLVLLLPHGHEGQGPDHSSARPERFLQLTAEKNMRVVNCTTAAQYFHVMRRQALLLKKDPLPLIIMSPKSLLRHPLATSSLRELVEGKFQPVLDDPDVDHDKVKRLVLCSGKVYVDLMSSALRGQNMHIAIARVEQLYPFPKAELVELFGRYPNLDEVVWLQEEPRNMGAWRFMQPRISDILPPKGRSKSKLVELMYIGRQRFASTAEGSGNWHNVNQEKIIAGAFDLNYIDQALTLKRQKDNWRSELED